MIGLTVGWSSRQTPCREAQVDPDRFPALSIFYFKSIEMRMALSR